MWRERIVLIMLAVAVSAGAYYYGRQSGIAVGQSNLQSAARQFAAARGGGSQAAGAARANGGAQGQSVTGTVTSVDGARITVTARSGSTAKIQLAANGTVRKQVDGQLSDVKAGDTIVAFGAMSGDTLEATTLQIGVGGFGGPRGGGAASQAP